MGRHGDRTAPPIVELPANVDPLVVYTANKTDTRHALRDLWRGRAGFLVGGGPSLNSVDYRQLGSRGICSLGINNVSAYVPVRAMVSCDAPEKFHYGCFFDPGLINFVALSQLKKRIRAKLPSGEFRFTAYRARDCPNVFGIDRTAKLYPKKFFRTDWASWGVNEACHKDTGQPKCIFTFFTALRLLHYLGVRRVYLLGVDFAMLTSGEADGNYAFNETGAAEGNNSHYIAAIQLLESLAPVFKKAKFEIYQTNSQSRLSLYPHVPFEQAVEDCRCPVPVEPFDLKDYYRFKGAGIGEPE